jgi:hypothetical protein
MQICGFLITFWYIGISCSKYFLLEKSFILKIHTKASTVTSQVKVSNMNFSSSSLLHTSSRICQLHFCWTRELPLSRNTLGSGIEPRWPSLWLTMLTKRATRSFPCQLHIVIWFASILISYFFKVWLSGQFWIGKSRNIWRAYFMDEVLWNSGDCASKQHSTIVSICRHGTHRVP